MGTDKDGGYLPREFRKFYKPLGLELHIFNLIFKGVLTHVLMGYTILYLVPLGYVSRWALVATVVYGYLTGFGTTVGTHRHWTHKTFEANTPLKVLLMLFQTASFQTPIFKWCVDHRLHHKYTDTNSDPYSAARGFWFSHITWLFQPSHPELLENEKVIEVSDLLRDPVVRFQAKYYWELFFITFFLVPMSLIQVLSPELTLVQNLALNFTRCGIALHLTFMVNSVAHIWGDKPYDKYITPVENKWVSIFTLGEGWHNYHHAFPWDYKSAELGYKFNISTAFIHLFAMIGWAWDLKTVSHKLLADRINRTGDGSHPIHRNKQNDDVGDANKTQNASVMLPPSKKFWGWGDSELTKDNVEITETLYPVEKFITAD